MYESMSYDEYVSYLNHGWIDYDISEEEKDSEKLIKDYKEAQILLKNKENFINNINDIPF